MSILSTVQKLFNNPPKVVIALVVFVLLLLAGMIWAGHARAAETQPTFAPYVQFDVGSTVVRGTAPVLDLTFTTPSSQLRGAYWEGAMTVIGSSTWNGVNAPNNVAARGLFLDGFGHFDLGLGLSWMMNPTPYNGSNVNFNLQADYRFTFLPITLTYTHMSDAGMKMPNYGRDIVMIGYRFH